MDDDADEDGGQAAVNFVLARAMMGDTWRELDERLALRKALLLLIFMFQERADPGAALYIEHLLGGFGPLAGYFEDDRHPFIGPSEILRWEGPGGRPQLLVQESFMRPLLEQFKSELADEDQQVE